MNQYIELCSTHKNWTTRVDIDMLMEQTINMTQGSSKETSRHEKLINGANRFFYNTAKKLSPQSKNPCK